MSHKRSIPRQSISRPCRSTSCLQQPSLSRAPASLCVCLRYQERKATFNARFEEVRARKLADVDKILDLNERIAEIHAELRMDDEELFVPRMHEREDKGSVLVVKDTEVEVQKYVSPQELEAARAKKAAEEARARVGGPGPRPAAGSYANSCVRVRFDGPLPPCKMAASVQGVTGTLGTQVRSLVREIVYTSAIHQRRCWPVSPLRLASPRANRTICMRMLQKVSMGLFRRMYHILRVQSGRGSQDASPHHGCSMVLING